MTGLTAKERARRSLIISELVELSKGGWYPLRSSDYEGLERELRQLDEKREASIERKARR